MRLVVLGTGTPNADPDRSGPALAIVKGERSYLFDAGPGIVRRAAAASRQHSLVALEASRLDTMFLTHLHSDHTLGLPDVMFSPWVLERTAPLALYGPPGTTRMARALQSAYRDDVRMRLDGGEPSNRTGWRTNATDIRRAGVVMERDGVRVEAIPVLHGTWTHAFGYRVSDGTTTIVISGDARPSPALREAARGADILAHEVYSTHRFSTRPPEWQRYHSSFHTSTRELAAIANETRPALVVLYHQLYWGATDEDLVAEMREFGYAGAVVSARDLEMY
ncbi:hydrolase [alpha proteobacterium U9-1i]|nr:hydrolase [alpha proteobacterium U9-1i]